MVKTYNSFVVRCWVLRDQPVGERQILDVEHVQSGGRFRTASFAEACAWMEATERHLASADSPQTPPEAAPKAEAGRADLPAKRCEPG